MKVSRNKGMGDRQTKEVEQLQRRVKSKEEAISNQKKKS